MVGLKSFTFRKDSKKRSHGCSSRKERRALRERRAAGRLKYLFKEDPIRLPFLELPRPGLRHYRSNCPRFANSSLLKRSCTTLRLSYAPIVEAFCSVLIKSPRKYLASTIEKSLFISRSVFPCFFLLVEIKRENNLISDFVLEFDPSIDKQKKKKNMTEERLRNLESSFLLCSK